MNNNPALKLAMAKLLPNVVGYHTRVEGMTEPMNIYWMNNSRELLETEWLYVMHLVEHQLESDEHMEFERELERIVTPEIRTNCWSIRGTQVSATFNQRATAMAKVKGIEV